MSASRMHHTVYLVEDSSTTRRLTQGLLEREGYRVRSFDRA